MIKIGVISDTHGNMSGIDKALAAAGKVDMWLHAGDFSQDAVYLDKKSAAPVTAVKGNCDGAATAKIDEFIKVGGKTIWLTHGHHYQAKRQNDELIWWAGQYKADIVVYGHSHCTDITWIDERLIFNPGSLYYPKGSAEKSFGVITIDDGEVYPELINI